MTMSSPIPVSSLSSSLSQQMDHRTCPAGSSPTGASESRLCRSALSSAMEGPTGQSWLQHLKLPNHPEQRLSLKSLPVPHRGLPYGEAESSSPSTYDFTTAYSYGTMERSYERDTQRMFERINASRQQDRQFDSMVETVSEILEEHEHDCDAEHGTDDGYADSCSDSDDGIFDMDF